MNCCVPVGKVQVEKCGQIRLRKYMEVEMKMPTQDQQSSGIYRKRTSVHLFRMKQASRICYIKHEGSDEYITRGVVTLWHRRRSTARTHTRVAADRKLMLIRQNQIEE